MKKRVMVILIILCMCIVVGAVGMVAFKNSNSVFKQNKKSIDSKGNKGGLFIENHLNS